MSNHGYETGRLDLPFVGVSTFAKRELVTDWSNSGGLELGSAQEVFVKHQLCSVLDMQALMIMKMT